MDRQKFGKIKKVTIVTKEGVEVHCVGEDNIIEMMDYSEQFETSVHTEIRCLDKNGNVVFEIINCPMVVERENEL